MHVQAGKPQLFAMMLSCRGNYKSFKSWSLFSSTLDSCINVHDAFVHSVLLMITSRIFYSCLFADLLHLVFYAVRLFGNYWTYWNFHILCMV